MNQAMIDWNYSGFPKVDWDYGYEDDLDSASLRVLVWAKFTNGKDDPEPRFARYLRKEKGESYWMVEGLIGTVTVLAWSYITPPDQSRLPQWPVKLGKNIFSASKVGHKGQIINSIKVLYE